MSRDIQKYIDLVKGRGIDWDGAFGNQCMDLYRHYNNWLGVPKQSMPVRGAADVWDTYLTEYYDRFVNTPDFLPKPGDIVIWSKNVGSGFGHIAIFVTGDLMKFTSLDQNWPSEGYTDNKGNFIGTGKVHLQEHTYNNVLGVLRPKEEVIPMPPSNDEFGDTVYKSSQYDEVVKGVYGADKDPRGTPAEELLSTINGYKSQATDMRNKLATAEAEIANRVEQVSRLKDEIAKEKQLYLDANTALNKATEELAKLRGSLEARIEELQGQVNQMGREKGKLTTKISVLEAEIANLKKGKSPEWTMWDWLIYPLPYLFNKLKSTKLGG